jgi:hypothetical protein
MLVAFGDFIAALQFLIVLILNAERLADVVYSILIRCRVVATGASSPTAYASCQRASTSPAVNSGLASV